MYAPIKILVNTWTSVIDNKIFQKDYLSHCHGGFNYSSLILKEDHTWKEHKYSWNLFRLV